MKQHTPLVALIVITFVLAVVAVPAHASDAVAFDGNDVPSVFFVAKSNNKNQVHYGIELDEQCRPTGSSPVVPYWRMLEKGYGVVEGLTKRERNYFGIAWQRPERSESGGTVEFGVRGLERPVRIEVEATDDGCEARAITIVGAVAAVLDRVFAKIGFFSLSHLDLFGRSLDGGRVRERIDR